MRKILPVLLLIAYYLLLITSPVEAEASILSDFSNWLAPINPVGIENSGPYQKLLPKDYQDNHQILDSLSPKDRGEKASREIRFALTPQGKETTSQEIETQGASPADLLKKLVASIFGYSADEEKLAFIPAVVKPRDAPLDEYCQGADTSYFSSLPAFCSEAKEVEAAGQAAETQGLEDLIPFLGTIKIAKNFMLDSLTPRSLQK